MAGVCKVDGCERPLGTSGYCYAHYGRVKRNGHPGGPKIREKNPGAICSVEGCGILVQCQGFCDLHYRRSLKGIDLNAPLRHFHQAGELCAVEGCDRLAKNVGYCGTHYSRLKKNGSPGPAKIFSYKREDAKLDYAGRRWFTRGPDDSGYIQCSLFDETNVRKQIAEHRVIMQNHLGRDLLPNENVHHINGVRDDNRLENLELWSSSQPSGQRVADKVAWAKEILALYASVPVV